MGDAKGERVVEGKKLLVAGNAILGATLWGRREHPIVVPVRCDALDASGTLDVLGVRLKILDDLSDDIRADPVSDEGVRHGWANLVQDVVRGDQDVSIAHA